MVLLLGVDAFLGLPTWRRWTELFDFAHVAVANRPGYTLDESRLPTSWPPRGTAPRRAEALGAAAAGKLVSFR
jgi:nicotinate-nucleotide adenylyltransferase